MKITTENIVAQWPSIKSKLNSATIEAYEVFEPDDFKDPDFAEAASDLIDAINIQLAKSEPAKPSRTPKYKVGDYVMYKGMQECYVEAVNSDGTYNLATMKTVIVTHMMSVSEKDLSPMNKEKPEPKKKPKFKVGDKVVTDHSTTEVYTVVEIENGKYKLDKTSGWWSESQLEKAKKPKKEPKPKPKKEPKVEPKFKVGDRVVRVTGLDKGTHKIVEIAVKSNGDIFYRFADGELNEWWIEALLEKVKKEPKPQPKPKQVNAISPAVKYISRYVKLHGKKYDSEAKNKARLILTALQKSILALEIRKADVYADEVNKMQNKLLKLVNGKCDQKAISIEGVEKLKEIAKGVAVNPAISMLRAFVALVGKSDVKEKAKALAVKINAANKTEANYGRQLHAALKSLNAYTSGDTAVVEADQQTLEGLYGLCGIDAPRERKHSASAAELANTYFDTIQMTGKWARIIGKPSAPFKIMIYGKPGSGKSTLALQHAGYMAKNHHHNVLYVAAEEGISYTMKDKLSRLGISDSNLTIVDELPKDLSKWDTIFIDSIQTAHLTPEDLRKLPKNKNYVYVFQTTKDGNFRGAQEYLHDVDTCVKVDAMRAYTEKNRFGAMGECGVI